MANTRGISHVNGAINGAVTMHACVPVNSADVFVSVVVEEVEGQKTRMPKYAGKQ